MIYLLLFWEFCKVGVITVLIGSGVAGLALGLLGLLPV